MLGIFFRASSPLASIDDLSVCLTGSRLIFRCAGPQIIILASSFLVGMVELCAAFHLMGVPAHAAPFPCTGRILHGRILTSSHFIDWRSIHMRLMADFSRFRMAALCPLAGIGHIVFLGTVPVNLLVNGSFWIISRSGFFLISMVKPGGVWIIPLVCLGIAILALLIEVSIFRTGGIHMPLCHFPGMRQRLNRHRDALMPICPFCTGSADMLLCACLRAAWLLCNHSVDHCPFWRCACVNIRLRHLDKIFQFIGMPNPRRG